MKRPFPFPSVAFCPFVGRRLYECSPPAYRNGVTTGIHAQPFSRQCAGAAFSTRMSPSGDGNGSDGDDQTDQRQQQFTSQDQQSDPSMFFELMSPSSSVKVDQMNTSSLAYLGDVVYELYVRSRYVWPNRRMSDLQNKVVSIVRAEAQSMLLQKFVDEFPLTSAEQGVLARGRNANLTARKKGKSANSEGGGASAYQDSTAFEALLGYTYITDKQRFSEMISWINVELDSIDGV